jgi:hypothetical protein
MRHIKQLYTSNRRCCLRAGSEDYHRGVFRNYMLVLRSRGKFRSFISRFRSSRWSWRVRGVGSPVGFMSWGEMNIVEIPKEGMGEIVIDL